MTKFVIGVIVGLLLAEFNIILNSMHLELIVSKIDFDLLFINIKKSLL